MIIKMKIDTLVTKARVKTLRIKIVTAIARNANATNNLAQNVIVIAHATIATAQNLITPAASE